MRKIRNKPAWVAIASSARFRKAKNNAGTSRRCNRAAIDQRRPTCSGSKRIRSPSCSIRFARSGAAKSNNIVQERKMARPTRFECVTCLRGQRAIAVGAVTRTGRHGRTIHCPKSSYCIAATRMPVGPRMTTNSTGRKNRIIGTVNFGGSAAAFFSASVMRMSRFSCAITRRLWPSGVP